MIVLDPLARFSLPESSPQLDKVWKAVRSDRRAAFRVRVPVRSVLQAETAAANAYAIGGLLLAVDELSLFWGPETQAGALWTCIMCGGNRGLDIAANVRRPSEFPRAFTSQTDVWCVFNTQEPRDLAYISQATRPAVADLARTVPRLSFVQYVCGDAGERVRRLLLDKRGGVDLE